MNNCADDFDYIIDEPVSITDESKGLCSGFGKFATDKIKHPNGDVELDSSQLKTIRMANIKELADTPESVKKDVAQWVIFSDVKTRTRSKQREQGRYYALWADIDENPIPLEQLAILMGEYFPNTDYEIYTSRSAKENYQKSRIIIPLLNTVSGDDFELLQECLNDWLASKNITPDRASESCNQVCYLPNKGEYYNNISLRDGVYLDGLKHFTNQLKQKKTELAQLQVERTERKKQTEIKRQQRTASGFASPIDEFNDLYPVEGILEANGYIADGARYIHPDSESGAASVSILNGRAHSLSSSDKLYTGGEGAHDAFSVFCLFGHNGDEKAAIIDAGNNYLNVGGESWNKVKQREYAEKKKEKENENAPKSFAQFALNGKVASMKQQMLDDVYILGEFALLGQITNLYAGPNTGKTLTTIKLLLDGVKANRIKGEDVFYINADDTYKGLVNKTEIVGAYGINMLAPGHNGFERIHVEQVLKSMTNDDSAKGKIIIIDTLKKFSDLMDKKASSNFMELLRQFVSKGGSAILLAHINKKRDDEGKPIFQGTTDSVDDADCCYTIDCVENTTELDYQGQEVTRKTILFENFKARGDVKQKHSYHYEIVKGQPYTAIIDSFKEVNESAALLLKEQQRITDLVLDNSDYIECVIDGIRLGVNQKTQILERLMELESLSKAKARKVIDLHTGETLSRGHRWRSKKGGDKNVQIYSEILDF